MHASHPVQHAQQLRSCSVQRSVAHVAERERNRVDLQWGGSTGRQRSAWQQQRWKVLCLLCCFVIPCKPALHMQLRQLFGPTTSQLLNMRRGDSIRQQAAQPCLGGGFQLDKGGINHSLARVVVQRDSHVAQVCDGTRRQQISSLRVHGNREGRRVGGVVDGLAWAVRACPLKQFGDACGQLVGHNKQGSATTRVTHAAVHGGEDEVGGQLREGGRLRPRHIVQQRHKNGEGGVRLQHICGEGAR